MATATLTVRPVDWAQARDRCLIIRRAVFIEEQNIDAGIEIDGRDPDCRHVLATAGDEDLGTGRLLPNAHIGRVAVLPHWRRHGVGEALMQALMDLARERGDPAVYLAAQESAIAFYHRLGFIDRGEPHYEAGILHQSMYRPL